MEAVDQMHKYFERSNDHTNSLEMIIFPYNPKGKYQRHRVTNSAQDLFFSLISATEVRNAPAFWLCLATRSVGLLPNDLLREELPVLLDTVDRKHAGMTTSTIYLE